MCGNCGKGGGTLILTNFYYGLARHNAARYAFSVTSWYAPRSNQEVRQDVPSWISLSVPLFMADKGEKHKNFLCIARHIATTSGRHGKQKLLLSCRDGRPRPSKKSNSNIVERNGEGPMSSREPISPQAKSLWNSAHLFPYRDRSSCQGERFYFFF